ncbi:MAG: hypothetical protein CSA26_03175 [Desulfobacterales bacterium]|nr:MAG: hypothetical protein CSA26_03175 [Desulfobacterales bacterium]
MEEKCIGKAEVVSITARKTASMFHRVLRYGRAAVIQALIIMKKSIKAGNKPGGIYLTVLKCITIASDNVLVFFAAGDF